MKSPKERASKRLQERNFKLNTLLEVSNAINNLEHDSDLYRHFQAILHNELGLGKAVLLSDYNGWNVNIKFGTDLEIGIDLIEKCLGFNKITVLNNHIDPIIDAFDVIIPIYHKSQALSFLLLGDFEGEKIEVSPIIRHLPFIQTLTNLIVVAQENRRLFEESLANVAVQKELELASRMQNMLIPQFIPERIDLDIFALYKPHQVVGGDYYDFFLISEDETVFCMADVSGKGMSAAMLMSNFQAMMHVMMEQDRDLHRIVTALNKRIFNNVKGEKFITTFIAVYNHKTHELTYVNSGHQPALLHHEGRVIELNSGSSVLGAFDVLPHLNIGKQKVAPNDVLVCFTDGVCEVENELNKEFGTSRIISIMPEYREGKAEELLGAVMNEINSFKGKRELPDDLALLCVRFVH